MQLPVSVFKEGKHFIAYTPVLDLSTPGKNYEEVKKRFKESVNIFFEELIKRGTLDEVLENLGWQKVKNDGRHLLLFLKNRNRFNWRSVNCMPKLKPVSWKKFDLIF